MRRRRLAVVLAGLLGLVMLPAISGAAPIPGTTTTTTGFFRFCAEAQIPIANIDTSKLVENGGVFSISGNPLKDLNDFIFSKSAVSTSANKILTTQWIQYTDAGQTQPKLLRCKFRTGESLNQGAWPPAAPNNGGRFAVERVYGFGAAGNGLSTNPATDQQCRVINQSTIDSVWASLSPGEINSALYNPTNAATPNAAANTLVAVPDTVVFDGPSWTPPVGAITLNGAVAELRSRALLAPTNFSGNARFEGAHYCTLAAPEFLKRVILGQVAPS